MSVDVGAHRGALLLEVGDGGVERLAHLHELELAVLDRALVPAQLLDVGLHGLQFLRRADLAGVHATFDLCGLVGQRAGFVVELLLLACDLVAFTAGRDEPRVERGRSGFGVAQCVALGKCVVTVEQSLEGGVVLLEGQEDVELARH